MTAPTRPEAGARPGRAAPPPVRGGTRPLVVSGALAASAVTVTGLVILTPLVVAGWIAAPHSGLGLPGVVRTATCLWLAAHHVEITLSGAGRIGMLPLGLVLLPGVLLWRAGRWLVRTGEMTKLSDVGYAALALAAPYAALCGALALASRSRLAAPSLPEAVIAGFLLALCAGGLGGARALAPWPRLFRLMPPRSRSVVLGTAGALAVLAAGGALLTAGSLAVHLGEYRTLDASLAPGLVGGALLVLVQLAYVPNAVCWAICYSLGPGFAFGTSTVIAPTGAALGPLPLFPMLAALPSGTSGIPGWVSAGVLALPYLAGVVGGILVARAAPTPAAELAPLSGFACGVADRVRDRRARGVLRRAARQRPAGLGRAVRLAVGRGGRPGDRRLGGRGHRPRQLAPGAQGPGTRRRAGAAPRLPAGPAGHLAGRPRTAGTRSTWIPGPARTRTCRPGTVPRWARPCCPDRGARGFAAFRGA